MGDSSDVMEGVSVSLLATGIRVTSDVEERQALFSLLANAVADRLEELSSEEVLLVSRLCLDHLLVAGGGGSGGEARKRDETVLTLCLATLSNLTIPEANTNLFLSITLDKERSDGRDPDSPSPTPPTHALHLTFMLTKFLEHNPQLEETKTTEEEAAEASSDCWEHVASVLCNLTQVEDGRRLLLRQSTGYMPKLVAQFRSKSVARRRGSVASFRSCLFDNEVHWWILHEVRALTNILLPLVVATPFTDQERKGMDPLLWMAAAEGGGGGEEAETEAREEEGNGGGEGEGEGEQARSTLPPRHEQQIDIVKMLLECLVLLCQRRGVREELRKRKVYPIVRNLDYTQEDEGVSEIINEVVQFMIRDEDESTPIDTPIDSVEGESFGGGGGGGGVGGGEQQRAANEDVDEVD